MLLSVFTYTNFWAEWIMKDLVKSTILIWKRRKQLLKIKRLSYHKFCSRNSDEIVPSSVSLHVKYAPLDFSVIHFGVSLFRSKFIVQIWYYHFFFSNLKPVVCEIISCPAYGRFFSIFFPSMFITVIPKNCYSKCLENFWIYKTKVNS